jgi:hypothetical protein
MIRTDDYLRLRQEGNRVTGAYFLYNGRIEPVDTAATASQGPSVPVIGGTDDASTKIPSISTSAVPVTPSARSCGQAIRFAAAM